MTGAVTMTPLRFKPKLDDEPDVPPPATFRKFNEPLTIVKPTPKLHTDVAVASGTACTIDEVDRVSLDSNPFKLTENAAG